MESYFYQNGEQKKLKYNIVSKKYLEILKTNYSNNSFFYNLKVDDKNFLLLIILKDRYYIFLFEKFDNYYFLVLYRDINLKKEPVFIKNASNTKQYLYKYSGDFLIVSKIYRKQDISLFSFYVYAIILRDVEKNKELYYQSFINGSSVTNIHGHTKCPYCSLYDPTCFIEKNKNKIIVLRPNMKFINYESANWKKNGCNKSQITHILVPTEGKNLISKVLTKYTEKKSKSNETLGVKLIEQCEAENSFSKKLAEWNIQSLFSKLNIISL